MLKLIKYEFRKNRTGLLVMLAVAAGLFLLAPAGRALEREGMMAASVVLLMLYSMAAYVFVLVRGIIAYSNELKTRTGYLLMMVPRSTMSILFSKLLFTLFFALLMMFVSVLALGGAGGILIAEVYSARGLMDVLRIAMLQVGLSMDALLSTAAFFVLAVMASVLTLVSVSYLSVTLSATVLQQGRLRGVVEAVIFIALMILTSWITNLVGPDETALYRTLREALRALLPSIYLNLAFTAGFTALSAYVLRKKVSL